MILGYAIKFISIISMIILAVASIFEKEKTKDPFFVVMTFVFVLTIIAIIL